MVGIEGVAQAEQVGEGRGGDKGGVEVQDDAGHDPDGDVDGHEEGDYADRRGGDAVEERRDGEGGHAEARHGD